MKNLITKGSFAFAALFMMNGVALAADQDFTILNKTGYAFKHIYVSESNSGSWDEDVLGRDVLNDGEEFELSFAKSEKTCHWDMKAIYDDGTSVVWSNLNLCKITKLTLRWNPKTDKTTAEVE